MAGTIFLIGIGMGLGKNWVKKRSGIGFFPEFRRLINSLRQHDSKRCCAAQRRKKGVVLLKEGTAKGYLGFDIKRDGNTITFTQEGLTKHIHTGGLTKHIVKAMV